MIRSAIFFIAVVTASVHVGAQQSYPMLMSIEPVAAQVGETSEHVVKSRYTMADAYEVLVAGDGVSGEIVLPEPKKDEKKPAPLQALTVRFQVDPQATPGVRDFRIATPTGVSTVGQLVIVKDRVIVESSDNNKLETATAAEIPATLCGRIERAEDVDFFKFHAEADETICFHVRCMRLQDRIHDLQQHADPIISIRNAAGSTIVSSDNAFAGDPFVSHRFTEAGDYYLELRDVRYQGNQYWGYSVEAIKRPFVQTVFPIAITAEEKNSVRLIGHAISEDTRGEISLAAPFTSGIQNAMVSVNAEQLQSAAVIVTDQLPVEESSQDNNAIDSAQSVSVPGGINGIIESENDIDYFAFDAKKGEKYSFEVIARRAGSSLDPHLRILNEKGGQQQLSDDVRIGKRNYADSRIENWSVPADGKYIAEVRDVHLRGGPSFVYYLSTTRSSPYFTLFADTDKTPVSPGTSGVVFVRTEKKNGFDGEIQLKVDGLPAEITASCGRILGGSRQDGCIVFSAAADAKPIASRIRISGVGTVPDGENQSREITTDATVYQETYQPGGGRGHWPVQEHIVSVGKPGDIREIKLSSNELTLKPGESTSIDVEIERAEGFDKNVILEVTYMHLSSVYGDPLPQGVSVDKTASKTLLTAGATKGEITLKAADNAQLAEKQQIVVMANVSINFVMKATYASDPVFLTVKK
jgi:hypothetical protein